jgi:hypothetical protein
MTKMNAGACQQTDGDSMTDEGYERLMALTPEMRAKVIRELKRRLEARAAGRPATFKRPKKVNTPPTPE